MRALHLTLLSPAAALMLGLGAQSPAMAAEDGEDATVIKTASADGPVEVVVTENADGETTEVKVVEGEDGEAVVEIKTDDGEEKSVVTIVDDEDDAVVIVKTEVDADDDDDDDDDDFIEEEIVEERTRPAKIKWLGLHVGAVFSPGSASGRVSSGDGRLRSNQFKACLDPSGSVACGYVKGLSLKVQMFETRSAWRYPRFVGYFRTGFDAGRVVFEPGEEGLASGQARRLDYTSVPLFLGGNLYLFDEFPVRPYAGLGFGFDVLRLDYRRHQEAQVVDASARIGFELHAGLEVRISNYIALNAEVMQLWSARRKVPELPDFSNTGLNVLAGVTVGIPVRLDRRQEQTTVRRVRRIRRRD